MASHRIRRNTTSRIVVLDTNAVMMLFEFQINLESELSRLLGAFHIIVPKQVIDELVRLKEQGKGKKQRNAKTALQLCSRYETIDLHNEQTGDDAILQIAESLPAIVLTNDQELRKRLNEKNIQSIFLRSKNHLALSY